MSFNSFLADASEKQCQKVIFLALWSKADLGERRRLLHMVLEAVYVDTRGAVANVTIRPKAVFELMFTEAGSLIPSR